MNNNQTINNQTIWKGQEALSKLDFYNTWIADQFKGYLGEKVLEVGIGTGNCTKYLLRDSQTYLGVDSNCAHVEYVKERFRYNANFDSILVNIDSDNLGSLADMKFDTILSINCFEHIKDDTKSFKNIYLLLKEKGRFIVLVPAMKLLYNLLDKSAGHFRRYSKREILIKLKQAGFVIEKVYFFNFLGAFLWFFSGLFYKPKMAVDHRIEPRPFLKIYRFVKLFQPFLKLQILLEKNFPIPFGSSLVCIAKKINGRFKNSERPLATFFY